MHNGTGDDLWGKTERNREGVRLGVIYRGGFLFRGGGGFFFFFFLRVFFLGEEVSWEGTKTGRKKKKKREEWVLKGERGEA